MPKFKKQYSYSDIRTAEKILANGFPDGVINYSSMYVIAKYFRHAYELGEKRLEKKLIEFCKSQDKSFNPVLEMESIKRWVTFAMNHDLREVNNIIITHAEMEQIRTVRDLKARKILFAVLVFSKSTKKPETERYYINANSFQNVMSLLDFKITENKLIEGLRELVKTGLVSLYLPNGKFENVLVLNFTNDNSPMALKIQFPEKCMEYYKSFFGGVSGYCVDCGDEIVKKSNSQVRCERCAKEKSKERAKLGMRNKRIKTPTSGVNK